MTTTRTDVPIQLTLRGSVTPGQVAYVLRKIEHLVRRPPDATHHVHVVITVDSNPASERPVRIEVSAVVAGRPIRAHVQATEVMEAGDLVVDRLQQRLVRARQRIRTLRRRADTRPTVRRKSFVLEPLAPQQAANEMDLLDHDFYLFIDAASDAAAVVFRRKDRSTGVLGQSAGTTGLLEYCGAPPVLTAAQAKERFEATADRFLFYRDPVDDRAHVLYRRYDGRFGVLVAS